MTARLTHLLEHVIDGEPELGDEVDAVFRQADRLRTRRTQALLGSAAGVVALLAAAGYLLTTTLLPNGAGGPPTAIPAPAGPVVAPSGVTDSLLALIAPVVDGKGMHIFPRPPERGNGWRQYSVVDADGKPHGTIEVAVYAGKDDLCFPVLDAPGKCADTDWAPAGVEYKRYDDDKDLDWQVHQTIARRVSDGRTVAMMATGERGTDDASTGKPALTGGEVKEIATGKRFFDAFGPDEDCAGTSATACPAFKVPVPAGEAGG